MSTQSKKKTAKSTYSPDKFKAFRAYHAAHEQRTQSKKKTAKVFTQKGYVTSFEVTGWDSAKELADFKIDLGQVTIKDEMSVSDLIAQMEATIKKLKAHKGDVFIIQ